MRTIYPANLPEFEATEMMFIVDKQLVFSVPHHLQKTGIGITLDDFGTGYPSLSMLCDFYFDMVKLDRSFMPDVKSSLQVRPFARVTISLRNSINTSFIAEGMKIAGRLQILEEEGCDEVQSFLFGGPVNIKRLSPSS